MVVVTGDNVEREGGLQVGPVKDLLECVHEARIVAVAADACKGKSCMEGQSPPMPATRRVRPKKSILTPRPQTPDAKAKRPDW